VLGALGAGAAIGALESWVSQWFSLLIVFPLAIGGVVGAFAVFQVERGNIRAPMLAALLALAGGMVGQGTVHAVDYMRFRGEFLKSLEERRQAFIGENSADEAAVKEAQGLDLTKLADDQIETETGSRGFVGYLKLAANEGTEIKKTGASSGAKVSGMGMWIMWGLEFLFAGGMALFMALGRAKKPFCEISKKWYDREDIVATGSAEKADAQAVAEALTNENWSGALAALGQPNPKAASVITLERCSHCEEHEPLLHYKLTHGLNTGKPQTKVKWSSLIKADEAKMFIDHAKEHAAAEQALLDAAAAQSGGGASTPPGQVA
jgi:hypothetical protein